MGSPPLESNTNLLTLRRWMEVQGFNNLNALVTWGPRGNWNGWKNINPPSHLRQDYDVLSSFLHGIAPLNSRAKDLRGWGKTVTYTVKEGYQTLKNNGPRHQQRIWEKIWSSDSIPKINIFFWLLAKNKLLITENLRKRRIHGPSRCNLCLEQEETSQHLFLECSFTIRVWNLFLGHICTEEVHSTAQYGRNV